MKLFKNLSLKFKLILIVLIISSLSILTGNVIIVIRDILNRKKELIYNLELKARLVADYSVPALLFDDKKGAEAILQKLKEIPYVVYSAIIDSSKTLYAIYRNTELTLQGDSLNSEELFFPGKKYGKVFMPIISGDETIGTLIMVATLKPVWDEEKRNISFMLMVFIAAVLMVLIMIYFFEKIITAPVIKLSKIAQHIRETGDLSVIITKESDDEIGSLYYSFNELLKSLEERKKERDEAEKKLLEEREKLEMRILERTQELSEAKERAEASDRLKSDFISNFSHEIRTPLNAIFGFTNLILEENLSPEEKKYAINSIEDAKDDLINMVENIIEISDLSSKRYKLTFSEININNEINELLIHANESIAKRKKDKVTLKTSLNDTQDLWILSDVAKIKKVLRNLLDNAIKFTEEGTIEVGSYVKDSETIEFYVRDTGIGISEDKKDKIFEKFYKIPAEKSLYNGAGLGLAVAKGIIEIFNGKIWFESVPGKGSTFYFTIPVQGSKKRVNDELFVLSRITLKGKKILIAEDSFSNYAYLAEVVKRNDMEPIYAKNGKEAYYLAKEHNFDLILMDILMPEMDGIEATRKIKELRPDIPVVAQTAINIYENEEDIKGLFDDYIIKPIHINELIRVITRILNKKQIN